MKVIRPSSMILQIMSDASNLSRRISTTSASLRTQRSSTRIPVVCSSVQEAEWAGTFGAATTVITERQTLAGLEYPQPPTLLHCDDNEVAVSIANKAVKVKLSKSSAAPFAEAHQAFKIFDSLR
jgi:hypothetical protein